MAKHRQYASGDVIIRENDSGDSAYLIEKGRVKITKNRGGRNVLLAELGVGDTIGEMSIIDDKPRSATVVALEECVLREVHRNEFSEALRTDADTAMALLRVIFERLRQADARIAELDLPPLFDGDDADFAAAADGPPMVAILEPMTREAGVLMPDAPVTVSRFPCRIGRPSRDPLVENDLVLDCPQPFQVSRCHLSLISSEGRIGVLDRGSARGSAVDGQRVGGPDGSREPVFFGPDGGELCIGDDDSPIRIYVLPQPAAAD